MNEHDRSDFTESGPQPRKSIFGEDKNPCRVVYGVASLPLGTPVELEVIFEVSN